jgi:mannose-6-phosphate isomerase-like protein (cupin superfamily)
VTACGGRQHADVVHGIVDQVGDTLRFYAPPPEIEGRPDAFPEAEPGLVGENLYLILKRAA